MVRCIDGVYECDITIVVELCALRFPNKKNFLVVFLFAFGFLYKRILMQSERSIQITYPSICPIRLTGVLVIARKAQIIPGSIYQVFFPTIIT